MFFNFINFREWLFNIKVFILNLLVIIKIMELLEFEMFVEFIFLIFYYV